MMTGAVKYQNDKKSTIVLMYLKNSPYDSCALIQITIALFGLFMLDSF